MKLRTLNDEDEGFSVKFERLIENPPSQILVFDPNTNPVKQEADIFFYFPCTEKTHTSHNCGFFQWVLSVKTNKQLYEEIEAMRRARDMSEIEAADVIKQNYDWTFSIVDPVSELNSSDIVNHVQDWLAEWVEELSLIPVRMASLVEHRRLWAHYEEFHPQDSEEQDPFYQGIRELLSDEINVNGIFYSKKQFTDKLQEQLETQQEKPHDDH